MVERLNNLLSNYKKEQIEKIASSLSQVKRFALQQFRPDGGTLDPSFKDLPIPPRKQMLELAKVADKVYHLQDGLLQLQ